MTDTEKPELPGLRLQEAEARIGHLNQTLLGMVPTWRRQEGRTFATSCCGRVGPVGRTTVWADDVEDSDHADNCLWMRARPTCQATDCNKAADTGSVHFCGCLLYTSPSPRDATLSRMPSSA